MARLTVAQRTIASKVCFILLLRGQSPAGEPQYCYLAVWGDKLEELRGVLSRQVTFNPQDYGAILASGLGEPTPEVRERMEREYGYNHDKEVPVLIDPPPGEGGD